MLYFKQKRVFNVATTAAAAAANHSQLTSESNHMQSFRLMRRQMQMDIIRKRPASLESVDDLENCRPKCRLKSHFRYFLFRALKQQKVLPVSCFCKCENDNNKMSDQNRNRAKISFHFILFLSLTKQNIIIIISRRRRRVH